MRMTSFRFGRTRWVVIMLLLLALYRQGRADVPIAESKINGGVNTLFTIQIGDPSGTLFRNIVERDWTTTTPFSNVSIFAGIFALPGAVANSGTAYLTT